ncbi:MAG: methylmalonyl-CoA epimerase [Sulfolobaceae archaeon]
MLQEIDHIGIVVEDIKEAIKVYTKLGFNIIHEEILSERGIKVAFLSINRGNSTLIELIEPIDKNDLTNPVVRFLKNRGQGLHHVAVRVSNIKKIIDELVKHGFEVIDKEPRKGARGYLVSFIHPKSFFGVLIELVEAS